MTYEEAETAMFKEREFKKHRAKELARILNRNPDNVCEYIPFKVRKGVWAMRIAFPPL